MTTQLRRGRVLRLMRGAGSTLTAHSGEVWITEEDSARDIVLLPGQSFRFSRPGLALVEAIADASVSLS